MPTLTPHFNIWLEAEGEVALSVWRIHLLEAIGRTGSISAAATEMAVPYRVAWQKLHEMEERLGHKLVATQTGGRAGGGTTLTPAAEAYIGRFKALMANLEACLQGYNAALFDLDLG